MSPFNKFLASGLLFFILPSATQADIVHLKNENNLTGKVLEDKAGTVKIDVAGSPVEVSKLDVDWILLGTEDQINDQRRVAGFFEKAREYFEKKEFLKALVEYKKAIRLEPNDANLYNNLGTTYVSLEDTLGAVQAYESALKIDPSNRTVLLNLSQALIEKGAYRKAEHWLRKLAVKAPQDSDTYLLLGVVYYRMGKYTRSISAYLKALVFSSGKTGMEADIFNNLGSCYAKLGRFEEAGQAYQKALQLNPHHPKAAVNFNIVTEALKQNETFKK